MEDHYFLHGTYVYARPLSAHIVFFHYMYILIHCNNLLWLLPPSTEYSFHFIPNNIGLLLGKHADFFYNFFSSPHLCVIFFFIISVGHFPCEKPKCEMLPFRICLVFHMRTASYIYLRKTVLPSCVYYQA